MVSANEHNPVVSFPETAHDLVVNHLVIAGLIETKAAVTGYDEKGVCQTVLDAQLEDNTLEVSVDVSGDENLLCVGIFENLTHFSAFLI